MKNILRGILSIFTLLIVNSAVFAEPNPSLPFTPVMHEQNGDQWRGFYFNSIESYLYSCGSKIAVDRIKNSYHITAPCEESFVIQDIQFGFEKLTTTGKVIVTKKNEKVNVYGKESLHYFEIETSHKFKHIAVSLKISENNEVYYFSDANNKYEKGEITVVDGKYMFSTRGTSKIVVI